MVFEDSNFEHRDYSPWMAYGQSKTANVLFALALDERARTHGVRAFSLHLGSIVDTGFSRYLSPEILRAVGMVDENGKPILDPAKGLKTVEQGAATSVWCATSPQLDGRGGVYCQDCDIAPLVSEELAVNQFGSMPLGVLPHAVDPQAADRLWRLSEHLVLDCCIAFDGNGIWSRRSSRCCASSAHDERVRVNVPRTILRSAA